MENQKNDQLKQYLVIAHFDGDHRVVDDLISARAGQGPAQFVVLVPSTPPRRRSLTWTEEQARKLAECRLDTALNEIGGLGADVSGEIGADSIPEAIGDTLRSRRFDEVILATPPPSLTERLFGDLESRVKQLENIPVTHIVVPQARAL